MFSLPKLLLLIAIIVVVWYGFKLVGRFDRVRKDKAKAAEKVSAEGRGKSAEINAEDMVECPVCSSYVSPSGNNDCGREDCPYTA